MRSAYDQLWAYVCSAQTPFDGIAVVDLSPEHAQQIQDHTHRIPQILFQWPVLAPIQLQMSHMCKPLVY